MKALGVIALMVGLALVVFFVSAVSGPTDAGASKDAHLVVTNKPGAALGIALVVTGSILLAFWRKKRENMSGKPRDDSKTPNQPPKPTRSARGSS